MLSPTSSSLVTRGVPPHAVPALSWPAGTVTIGPCAPAGLALGDALDAPCGWSLLLHEPQPTTPTNTRKSGPRATGPMDAMACANLPEPRRPGGQADPWAWATYPGLRRFVCHGENVRLRISSGPSLDLS